MLGCRAASCHSPSNAACQVAKNAAGFYEQLGVFAGALVVAVPVISFSAIIGFIMLHILSVINCFAQYPFLALPMPTTRIDDFKYLQCGGSQVAFKDTYFV